MGQPGNYDGRLIQAVRSVCRPPSGRDEYWPVAGGVLVDDDGTAYLAAGIVNYDGTYVYALDVVTGKLKWQNNISGHLDPEAHCGISVQGHLLLHDGKLYMSGGTSISPGVYDITDGKCLNDTHLLHQKVRNNVTISLSPRGWELFLVADKVVVSGQPYYGDPRYPVYDPSVSKKIYLASTDERDIVWLDNQKVMCFAAIDRKILRNCVTDTKVTRSNVIPAWGKLKIPDKPLWQQKCDGSVAIAVCRNAVLVAGQSEIAAIKFKTVKRCGRSRCPLRLCPGGWLWTVTVMLLFR